jgi:hypothetical protein
MNGVMYFWGGASWREYQIMRPNEAIQWAAINMGKKKGVHTYDMGGGGEYKRKYGGYEIEVPWFRKSKYAWIRYMRDLAECSHKTRRRYGQLSYAVVPKTDESSKKPSDRLLNITSLVLGSILQ